MSEVELTVFFYEYFPLEAFKKLKRFVSFIRNEKFCKKKDICKKCFKEEDDIEEEPNEGFATNKELFNLFKELLVRIGLKPINFKLSYTSHVVSTLDEQSVVYTRVQRSINTLSFNTLMLDKDMDIMDVKMLMDSISPFLQDKIKVAFSKEF